MRPVELTQEMIDMMNPDQRKDMGLTSSAENEVAVAKGRQKYEDKLEKVIQNEVEAYLTQLGYEKRSPEAIARGMPRSGSQLHFYNTKRNPIVLDLIVLSHSGKFLELELKTKTGSPTPEQACIIACGGSLAYSSEEAFRIIRDWHESLSFIVAEDR
jgi:hypothetical protein